MSKRFRTIVFNVLKVVVSVGMLAYVLLVRVDWREMAAVVSRAQWRYLAAAAALAFGGVALRAVRWRVLLRALEIDVPLVRLVRLYFVGTFFNTFLPTGLGGDAIRVVELARHGKRTPEVAGTVLLERANGLWVLFLIGLLALPFAADGVPARVVALVAVIDVAVVIGGWLVMGTGLVPWLGSKVRLPAQEKLERFYRAVSGCGYAALGRASAVSLAFNAINITINVLIARGLNIVLPVDVFAAFAPILSASLLLPAIGGLGVRETAHVLLYGTVDVGDSAAAAMGLAQFGAQTLLPGLVGAVIYLIEGVSGLRGRPEQTQE